MAKNREAEKPVNSHSESAEEEDEEEDASSEEVDSQESESDPEPALTQVPQKSSSSTPATQKKVQAPPSAKPQQAASSSEEEESGSESESESERPDMNVRPISSKPMDDPERSKNGARKPRSKPSAPEPVTPTKSSAAKRPAEDKETAAKEAKKAKKMPETETSEKKSNDDSKKLLFQRLWSEEDEIVILKGMIDYASKKKSDPVADLNAFHDFIKKNLHVDVTRTQLQDKIRRLRKKYENNKSKEKEGKDRTFSKPHEQRAFEISKSIWGNDAGKENGGEKGIGSPKSNGAAARKAANKRAANANAADNEEGKESSRALVVSGGGEKPVPGKRVSSSGLSVEERILRAGAELFEEEGTGLEGEKQWKKLKREEIEIYLRQMEVKVAQTRLVLDVLKSAEH